MKVWTLAILTAMSVYGCRTTTENADSTTLDSQTATSAAPLKNYMKLRGALANDLYNALSVSALNGEKIVKGTATISCSLQSGSIPPGAQGIVAPMASCVGFPKVTFPAGALGLVAPWFNLNGFSGYQFYSKFPAQAELNGSKSVTAEFEIMCRKSTSYCRIKKGADTPVVPSAWINLEGTTAKNLYDAMNVGEIGSVKSQSGNASLYCKVNVPTLPVGAQGIVAPMANCVAYPKVTLPPGAQGIAVAAPWFNLNGFDGYVLFEKMTGISVVDQAKTYSGNLSVNCTKGATYKCEIRK